MKDKSDDKPLPGEFRFRSRTQLKPDQTDFEALSKRQAATIFNLCHQLEQTDDGNTRSEEKHGLYSKNLTQSKAIYDCYTGTLDGIVSFMLPHHFGSYKHCVECLQKVLTVRVLLLVDGKCLKRPEAAKFCITS